MVFSTTLHPVPSAAFENSSSINNIIINNYGDQQRNDALSHNGGEQGRRLSFSFNNEDAPEELQISPGFFDEVAASTADVDLTEGSFDNFLADKSFLDDFDMQQTDNLLALREQQQQPLLTTMTTSFGKGIIKVEDACDTPPPAAEPHEVPPSPTAPISMAHIELIDINGNQVQIADGCSSSAGAAAPFALLPSSKKKLKGLSKMVTPNGKKSKKIVKTVELAPLRALSAYNFFFRDQRERLLYGGELEFTEEKCMQLLSAHWNRDRAAKRKHRKTHGKIPFTELSKLVSKKWKELSEANKEFYRQVSSKDWERYQRELNEHKIRQAATPVSPSETLSNATSPTATMPKAA